MEERIPQEEVATETEIAGSVLDKNPAYPTNTKMLTDKKVIGVLVAIIIVL